ncbi:MAG: hypothetical protein V1858_00305, partial [Candidatus Gottesmanbacteria bacterium]
GVSLSNDVQNKTSSKGWQVAPEDLSSSGIKAFGANQYKYDYTHYADKFNITSSTLNTFDGTKPNPASGITGIYFARPTNPERQISISVNWPQISQNDKIIILIDGNLDISKDINVASGGFIAFIVSGDITFYKYLGINPIADPHSYKVVDGIYIADGTISTGDTSGETDSANKKQFIGKGMFIAGNFSLGRTLPDNSTMPAEYFEFRPDLLVNFPKEMGDGQRTWSEVAP